ncbi:1-deoxy-D-xylulose-5-phosphate reductoisomerase [Babesia microti strain RI]|uniref:1-deoxy-D-xylulose 5-phosphate reductoisomerase, apicoplastic n=2 Tax=Babesia microti TaxID=5868 RepID=A0A1R4AAL7_BABMR|nr:1-deoxy-D-xylulose-5-phosphate reductoisomerase [Babesia microti strain RI]QEX51284.1 1-deoxy-D-xylulose 5-phosphate reductoisomerase [Babesia microti]SJK86027.1 1-deoxy-D-xylulose-5-phosphate reductoisomerase [Babesia microti strain RI]|eukprot:XP_021338225.1 1-deoxy-D-xylulose-5-phosphate reductoisomerase [Babesia microti strain RI]
MTNYLKLIILTYFYIFTISNSLKSHKHSLYNDHIPYLYNFKTKFFNTNKISLFSSLNCKISLEDDPKIGVIIAGSTGSVGTQTLEVLETICNSTHKVVGLSANTNMRALADQIIRFRPRYVSVGNENCINELQTLINIPNGTEVLHGKLGLQTLCSVPEASVVMMAISGCNGILPTISAAEHGKTICLANKETIISAGRLLFNIIHKTGSIIQPVDSEHCALYQCIYKEIPSDCAFGLVKGPFNNVNKMILTCSGGPCLNVSAKEIYNIRFQDIKHPVWNMGSKINVDSATLMNKGFEIIEAYELFGTPIDRIKTIIHKESIIHSLVEFNDKSTIAQLYLPDMKLPILQSLTSPGHMRNSWPPLNLETVKTLTFDMPDFKKFPCLGLAYQAGKQGGLYPGVMNAANEVANNAFRNDHISLSDIPEIIKATMNAFNTNDYSFTLESILETHNWALDYATNYAKKIKC